MNPNNETKIRMRARLLAAEAQRSGEQGHSHTNNKPSRKLIYTVAAIGAICACLTVTFAATYYLGAIDHKGNRNPNELLDTTSQPIGTEGDKTIEDYAHEILAEQPKDELWYIYWDNGQGVYTEPTEHFSSFEQLTERVRAAYVEIYLPVAIPNGYSFVEGWVSCFVQPETSTIIDLGRQSVETPQGEVIKHIYSYENRDPNTINGYCMLLRNEAGEELTIYAHMEESLDAAIGQWEGNSFETLDVWGMDEAIFVGNQGDGTIIAKRVFPFGIRHLDLLGYLKNGEQTEKEYLCTNYQMKAENRNMQQLSELFGEAFISVFPSVIPSMVPYDNTTPVATVQPWITPTPKP